MKKVLWFGTKAKILKKNGKLYLIKLLENHSRWFPKGSVRVAMEEDFIEVK